MVERNISNHAEARFDHVGRVQSSTHADFKHCDFDFLAREVLEGNGGEHLEEARVPGEFGFGDQTLGGAIDDIVNEGEIVVGNAGAVNSNALVDANQVGRSVEAGLVARDLEDRSKCGGG